MQLLTSDIMQELVDFRKKTNLNYDIVIKNNVIYLRFHCGYIFEPQAIRKGIADKKSIERYFNILNFIYELSKKLIKTIDETEI